VEHRLVRRHAWLVAASTPGSALVGLGWNVVAGVGGGVGTLLGPEGAGDVRSFGSSASASRVFGVLSWVWDWPSVHTLLGGLSGLVGGGGRCGLVLSVA
jgi:hypothetical protein